MEVLVVITIVVVLVAVFTSFFRAGARDRTYPPSTRDTPTDDGYTHMSTYDQSATGGVGGDTTHAAGSFGYDPSPSSYEASSGGDFGGSSYSGGGDFGGGSDFGGGGAGGDFGSSSSGGDSGSSSS